MNAQTTISIITAVYNGAATIAHCIESVQAQSLPVEHIIIDGGSTDDTLAVVERYRGGIARVVSEPDRGIYDAMNKGIAQAGGDIVGILNADDFYADGDVLSRVAAVFTDQSVDACYGDLLYVKEAGAGSAQYSTSQGEGFKTVRYWKSGAFSPYKFYWGWMPPHPTFFVRRSVYERHGLFDLTLGSAADYELMLRSLCLHRIAAAYIPEVLVKMRTGGASNATLGNRWRANRMDRLAWERNGLRPLPWTLMLKPLRKVGQWMSRPR